MLEARQLFKNIGTTPIIRGVDLTFKPGRITGILSLEKIETRTLLSLLSGHEKPLSGTLSLDGIVLEPRPQGFKRDGIQLIPGTSRLFDKLTILKNLILGIDRAAALGRAGVLARVEPRFADFGFARPLETIVGDLTIPEQQLVSLVLFLSQDAPVLLLRDVFNNLSLDQYECFVRKARDLAAEGRIVAVVPDHPAQLLDFCDDVVLLRNGRSIFSAPAGEIALEEVFNVLNNSEHTIRQSLENKFHHFQTTIADPSMLYEKTLGVLGNFCGPSPSFLLSQAEGGLQLTLGKTWRGAPPEKADLEELWGAVRKPGTARGTVLFAGGQYAWTSLQPPEAGGAYLFLSSEKEPEFPFQVVVDGLIQTLAVLADRLEKEAEARQRELETIRLGKEMDIARNIQASILPRRVGLPGYTVAAHTETATEVGGDSWDLFPTSLGTFISIGDVSGHGLPSGIMALIEMAALHGIIQTHLQFSLNPLPHLMYDLVNKVLCEINRDRIGSDKFMTKVLLVENQGSFLHGGTHEVGLLYTQKDGQIQELRKMVDSTGFLGISELLDSAGSLGRFTMDEGDFLLLYTDGLIEAKNARGEQYGIERVKACLMDHLARAPEEMLSALRSELFAFAEEGDCLKHGGRLADDLTLLLMRRNRLASTPAAL